MKSYLVALVAISPLSSATAAQLSSVTDPSALHSATPITQPTKPITTAPAAATPMQGDQLNNAAVITLTKAGLGPEALVAKVNTTRGIYDTSANALIELKNAGVADSVIAAMLTAASKPTVSARMADNSNPDPMVPHSPGLYMLLGGDQPHMVRIDPTTANQTKTSNIWGYAFSYGLAPLKLKTVIPNAYARVRSAANRPTFYFFFNSANPAAEVSGFGSAFSIAATSPNEFSLVRFEQKSDRREAVIGSVSIGGAKTGVSDKARVAFDYSELAPGVFKASPTIDLAPGQYGFVYSMGGSTGASGLTRIFDFTVG